MKLDEPVFPVARLSRQMRDGASGSSFPIPGASSAYCTVARNASSNSSMSAIQDRLKATLNFVPAHCLGLAALESCEPLDRETDPSLSDLFRVFGGCGKLCGDQRSIFGIELERFFEDLFYRSTHTGSVRHVLETRTRCEILLRSGERHGRFAVGTPLAGNHCACLVEAVGIEPCLQRYAHPRRTLGFLAYRYQRHATRPLTHVPCSALESPCLPCALGTIRSLTIASHRLHLAQARVPPTGARRASTSLGTASGTPWASSPRSPRSRKRGVGRDLQTQHRQRHLLTRRRGT